MRNRQASVEDDPVYAGATQKGSAIVCGRRHLRRLRRSDVLVTPGMSGKGGLAPRQYFRIVLHDIPLKTDAGHLYEADEWEMYVLENKVSPITREALVSAGEGAGVVSLEGIVSSPDKPEMNGAAAPAPAMGPSAGGTSAGYLDL